VLENDAIEEVDKFGENNVGVVGGMRDGVGRDACEAMTDEAFCGVADTTGNGEVVDGNDAVEAIYGKEFCETFCGI